MHLMFGLWIVMYIRTVGAPNSHECLIDAPWQHIGLIRGCLSSSSADPLFLPMGSRLGVWTKGGGNVGSTGCSLSWYCSLGVINRNWLLLPCVGMAASLGNVG